MVSLCHVGFQFSESMVESIPLNFNRPHEIGMMMSPLVNVVKLANVARMAHKYHFANLEEWARSAFISYLQVENSIPIETHSLVHATEVAVLCDDAKLLQLVRTKWTGLIEEKKDLSLAINVFERLGMCDLRGLAYYAMMLQGRGKWNSDPLLTREQRIRLLSGYYTISEICANLPSNPPTFPHHISCQFEDECQESWESLWKDNIGGGIVTARDRVVVGPDKNDLIGKMKMSISLFKTLMAKRSWPGALNFYCAPFALEVMIQMAEDFKAQLIGVFRDVD